MTEYADQPWSIDRDPASFTMAFQPLIVALIINAVILGLFLLCVVGPFVVQCCYFKRREQQARRDYLRAMTEATFEPSDLSASKECIICAGAMTSVTECPCHHKFHTACIDRWRQTSRTCPVCRADTLLPAIPAPAPAPAPEPEPEPIARDEDGPATGPLETIWEVDETVDEAVSQV